MAYNTFFILSIWANAFVRFSMATLLSQTIVQTITWPASGPSIAQAPFIRKLGRHGHQDKLVKSAEAPYLSPSVQPDNKKKPVQSTTESSSPNEGSSVEQSSGEGLGTSERHVTLVNHHYHHHSFDKSIAGGGVILGGLATVFVVAVLCYIRATGGHSESHKGETVSGTAASP